MDAENTGGQKIRHFYISMISILSSILMVMILCGMGYRCYKKWVTSLGSWPAKTLKLFFNRKEFEKINDEEKQRVSVNGKPRNNSSSRRKAPMNENNPNRKLLETKWAAVDVVVDVKFGNRFKSVFRHVKNQTFNWIYLSKLLLGNQLTNKKWKETDKVEKAIEKVNVERRRKIMEPLTLALFILWRQF